MINFELGPSTILGIVLICNSLLLYGLRKIAFVLARDYDILFSTLGFLTGGILIFQGWRLDPILLFCQICSMGMSFFFAWESIRMRICLRHATKRLDQEKQGALYKVDRFYECLFLSKILLKDRKRHPILGLSPTNFCFLLDD
nr:hypothetical chloroplast RF66 [Entransia fimbriata]WKT05777.1 hypothetical chloroplast RF66 [Entransia fimbriata]WKT05895.1 hypothetical chloroplast RF66 [Entransia fimbriata]WKT05896.1 hypothetical chloroplast RF66 [Entransia fimbriata]